jgi:superfamily I DNA/RNA helicase/RecB family exonuclease
VTSSPRSSERTYRLVRPARTPAVAPVLDAAQRRVVEHAGGPLLVLAGPGTGKTTTLVEAAVARVVAGVPVDQLLMLTFSRRAAGELRDRVTARLDRTVREPVARTLHSYAFGVLRMHAVAAQLPAPRLLSGAEQDVVIRQLLSETDPQAWPAALRPALHTRGFAGDLRDLLMRAVERGLDADRLRALGQARGRADWVAAAHFLREYQDVTVLRDPGGYDPAELIRSALNVLSDEPTLLAAERSRRRRIFVDEYQDTDPAQAQLLALLADGADELILVGDPDQSIYGFRGADTRAIHEVDQRFGGGGVVPTVALGTARRFGPELITASRRVAARLPGRAEQRVLQPAGQLPPGRVDVGVLRSASEEAAYLAGVLRRAHLDGLPWSRMAVLVRSTTLSLGTLRRAMMSAGVPVRVRGEDIPLAEQPAVEMLLLVLHCVLEPAAFTEDVAEQLLLGPLGGGDPIQLRRLRRVLRQLAPSEGGQLRPTLHDPAEAEQLPEHVRRPVARVARVLAATRQAVLAGHNAETVLWQLWQASRLGPRWETASLGGGSVGVAADRDLDAVLALFDAAARFVDRLPSESAAGFAAHLRAQQIPGDTMGPAAPDPEAVSILTAHASKGLEWDLVGVAGVQEGVWPDLRHRGTLLGVDQLLDAVGGIDSATTSGLAAQLAEERRLFYVAITRARERLVVTAVAGDDEQPSRFLDELDPVGDEGRPITRLERGVHLPGLVAELRSIVCDDAEPAPVRQAAAVELARLAGEDVPGADPDQWWGLAPVSSTAGAADPDRPVRVSPSRVESFLTCELRALMEMLGVRDDTAAAASLGTVIHDLAAQAPAELTLAQAEALLDARWGELEFGASWFADNERERASGMLVRLVEWLRDSRQRLELVGVELPFDVLVGDVRLIGRVDRLERDDEGRLVVVDFKTGKGKPSADELSVQPQLGTYQLAIEHDGFAEHGAVSGGGLLVQLGSATRGGPEQRQLPLAEADDPHWARQAVEQVGERLRGPVFTAIENKRCQICDVRSCCPLQPNGRQVPS